MDLSYGILYDSAPDRILEGFIEGDMTAVSTFVQHQVEGSGHRTAMTFLPILQSVAPETPKFRGARRNLEPMVANEEEIVGALLQPSETPVVLPDEAPGENVSQDFRWRARGYVQQRIPGAFELDYVSPALFNLLLQGSYRVDVGLMTHTGAHIALAQRSVSECIHVHRYKGFLLVSRD